MIEIILIIILAAIFIIFLRKLPEVKVNSDLRSQISVNAPGPLIITHKPISAEKIGKLWKRADFAFERGNFTKAERFYLKIATSDPQNPKIYGRLGIIYLEQKNFLDAKEAFGEAIKKDSKNALWYNNLGLALYNLKRFSESIEAYKKSVALDSGKAIRFFNLGLVYEAIGEYQNALSAYERAAALEPENIEFQSLISRIKDELEKSKK